MDPVFGILIWRLKDIDWLDGVHVWNSETAVMMTWSVRQISNTSCEKEGTKCFTIFWKVTFIFCFFPILELLRSQTIFVLLVLIPSFNLLLTQTPSLILLYHLPLDFGISYLIMFNLAVLCPPLNVLCLIWCFSFTVYTYLVFVCFCFIVFVWGYQFALAYI